MYMMLLPLVIYHIPKQWNPQNESNLTATANSIPHHQIWWQQPNADKKKVPILSQDQTTLTQPTDHHFKDYMLIYSPMVTVTLLIKSTHLPQPMRSCQHCSWIQLHYGQCTDTRRCL